MTRENNKAYCQYLIDTMFAHNPILYNINNYHIKELTDFINGTGRNDLKGRIDERPKSTQIQGDNFWLTMKYDDLNMWNRGDMKQFELLSYAEWLK